MVVVAITTVLAMMSLFGERTTVGGEETRPRPLEFQRQEVRLPLSRCFGHRAVEQLITTTASRVGTILRELESVASVNVTELLKLSTEGRRLHAGIRSNPFAPFATCEPPSSDGLRPGYGLLLHGVQLLVSGRRDVNDLKRPRIVDAEKEFRMGIVIRVPVSMARRMRDESVLKHLLKRVAYGIAVCNADPSRLLLKGLDVPTAVWAFELLPQCVLYDDGPSGQEVSESLDPPWVGEDGTFINDPAPELLSSDTHSIPYDSTQRPRRVRRFAHIGGQRWQVDIPYHGLFEPHGIAMTAWVIDRGLQCVRHYAPYLANASLHVTTRNPPLGNAEFAEQRNMFVEAAYNATVGGSADFFPRTRSDPRGDHAAPIDRDARQWAADYFFVAAWDVCHRLWPSPLCQGVMRRWGHSARSAMLKLFYNESAHSDGGAAVLYDWQRGATIRQNGHFALADVRGDGDARRPALFNGLPRMPRGPTCVATDANEASNLAPVVLSDAVTVLYAGGRQVQHHHHPKLAEDERNIREAFYTLGLGRFRNVRFGSRSSLEQQLDVIWRYPVVFFVDGAFMMWMLVARPNTTFVMYYESTSASYARESLPYVYPLLMFAYHTFVRSRHVRLVVFVREAGRTASVDDLVAAVREPFETAFVLLRSGRNRTVLRADSYPHHPATGLFEHGFPLN